MATFPSMIQMYGSGYSSDEGFRVSRSESGKPKIRSYYTGTVKSFVMQFYITPAEKTTLESFYTTNKKIPFDFVFAGDGITYSCRFIDAIQYKPSAGDRWDVQVKMEVVT